MVLGFGGCKFLAQVVAVLGAEGPEIESPPRIFSLSLRPLAWPWRSWPCFGIDRSSPSSTWTWPDRRWPLRSPAKTGQPSGPGSPSSWARFRSVPCCSWRRVIPDMEWPRCGEWQGRQPTTYRPYGSCSAFSSAIDAQAPPDFRRPLHLSGTRLRRVVAVATVIQAADARQGAAWQV